MSWKNYNLGELVDSVSIRAKDIVHGNDLRFLGVSNEDGITISKYAAEDKAEDYKIIEKGCFAYNPYRINVGSVALMKDDLTGLISPAYVVFKPKPSSIIPELLLSFLKSKEGLRQIKLNARGTVRQALRFEDLCKIQLSLPSYDKQMELYLKLQKFEQQGNKQVIEHTHQLDLLKKLRQQILQDAVQGKLVKQNLNDEPSIQLLKLIKERNEKQFKEKKFKKDNPLTKINQEEIEFEIPKKWTWCRLGEIADLNGRIGWKGLSANEYKEKGPLFLSVHSLNYGDYVDYNQAFHITQERYNESPEIMLQNDDILICKDGAGIGKLGIIKDLKKQATVNSSLLIIRCNSLLNVKYIYYYLLSDHFQNIVNSRIMGATTPHLYQRDMVNFLVALPPSNEQLHIVNKIQQLMKLCDELEQSIQQNQKYTQELLQVALKEALEQK